jgi:hypothetical protein
MNGCIIFASHVPSKDKLFVGKEFLDKFLELFNGYTIYIGVSNSCKEWYEMLESYSKKINIIYSEVPKEFDSGYGVVGAYQIALRLLRDGDKKYDIYWFGHTKGVTSNSHDFRYEVFDRFWNRKELVEEEILKNNFSIYAPYIGNTAPNYLNTTLPIFIDGNINDDLACYYSFWVHNGEVINKFINQCNPDFFKIDLLTFKRLKEDEWGSSIDRYFFERDFPMIYQKLVDNPKLLYNFIHTNDNNVINYIKNNPNNKKIIF